MGTLVTADGGFDLQKKAGRGGRGGEWKIGKGRPSLPARCPPPSPEHPRCRSTPPVRPKDLSTFPADFVHQVCGFGNPGCVIHFINVMLISWKATH